MRRIRSVSARAVSGHAAAPPRQRDELASPHGLPSVRGYTLLHRDRNAALCITAKLIGG